MSRDNSRVFAVVLATGYTLFFYLRRHDATRVSPPYSQSLGAASGQRLRARSKGNSRSGKAGKDVPLALAHVQ